MVRRAKPRMLPTPRASNLTASRPTCVGSGESNVTKQRRYKRGQASWHNVSAQSLCKEIRALERRRRHLFLVIVIVAAFAWLLLLPISVVMLELPPLFGRRELLCAGLALSSPGCGLLPIAPADCARRLWGRRVEVEAVAGDAALLRRRRRRRRRACAATAALASRRVVLAMLLVLIVVARSLIAVVLALVRARAVEIAVQVGRGLRGVAVGFSLVRTGHALTAMVTATTVPVGVCAVAAHAATCAITTTATTVAARCLSLALLLSLLLLGRAQVIVFLVLKGCHHHVRAPQQGLALGLRGGTGP